MKFYELDDGFYLAHRGSWPPDKNSETFVLKIGTSKLLVDMGHEMNVAKYATIMGRSASPKELDGCEFKRIDPQYLWSIV